MVGVDCVGAYCWVGIDLRQCQFYLCLVAPARSWSAFLALTGAATGRWLQWLIFAACGQLPCHVPGRIYGSGMRARLPALRRAVPAGEIGRCRSETARRGETCRMEVPRAALGKRDQTSG